MRPLVAITAFVLWLAFGDGSERTNHVVTDVTFFLSSAAAAAACLWTARRRPQQRAAWRWLAASCATWLLAVVVWSYYELVLHQYSPSPSWADVGFIGYCIPAVIGLTKLAASGSRRTRRTRLWLDATMISLALFTLSWLIVLEPMVDGSARRHLTGRVVRQHRPADRRHRHRRRRPRAGACGPTRAAGDRG